FNKDYGYPYLYLNDKPFTNEFKEQAQALTKAKVEFGVILHDHWNQPRYVKKYTVPAYIQSTNSKWAQCVKIWQLKVVKMWMQPQFAKLSHAVPRIILLPLHYNTMIA
ncbi:nucleotide-diphospho-sugar transferase, partial [Cyathus striatus]